jgi:predicted MPP superfamily phosphohydrolase
MNWFLSITILLTLILIIVPHLVWGVVLLLGKLFHTHAPYAPFGWAALALVLIAWSLLAYGNLVGRWRFVVNEIEYSHSDIPQSFDGYRIIHISDLHLISFDNNHERLTQVVERINALNADLVCFTGDLVNLSPDEITPYIADLTHIDAPDGVVSVLGNHDFMLYAFDESGDESREQAVERLSAMQRQALRWHLLRNENYTIYRNGEKITILGVDNESCS